MISAKSKTISNEHLFLQSLRAGLYLLIALLALMNHFFQGAFLNWPLMQNFYLVSAVGIILHLSGLFMGSYQIWKNRFFITSFVVDLALLSYLLFQTELNQSLFLFLDLLVILVCGLVYGITGALILASGFSIATTLILALGPEMKSLSFFFLLILNNLAYFSVATISGYLADQLESQGIRLSSLKKLHQSIVETIPSGILTIDVSGKILQANPVVAKIFFQSDFLGESIENLIPDFLWKSRVNKGKYQKHLKLSNQEEKVLDLQVISQKTSGEESYLVLLDDKTEIRKLEFAVRESEKLAAVGQLAAGIAHEIRNPLAGISGSIELLSEHVQNEDDKKLNKIILKEIDRLNVLVGDFLDFAKPEKKPTESHDVSRVLNEVLDIVKLDPKLPTEVQVVREIDSDLFLICEPSKLKQAFLNIVMNAYQAMEKSPTRQLKVQAHRQEKWVEVKIKDSGQGMDEATRQKMFIPFHTTKAKGTGLGLAITLKIFDLHQAQIFVESEKQKGTSFEIRLPFSLV